MNCYRSVYDEECRDIVINGYTGFPAKVVIPDTIEEKPVVKIGEWAFDNCKSLTRITIPVKRGTKFPL